jgi:peptidoglycan/LPS O-acetylase OafA/YrhL
MAESPPIQAPSFVHPSYRADVDGLRAVAVLSVVTFHAFPRALPGGFTGVDVFFVISGFLISTIIWGSLDKGVFSLAEFYARRVRRIFPALLVVLVACFAFGWVALFADELKEVGKHMAGGAGFVSNLLLLRESGYFDTAAEAKPLLHLWSLGIEEQFYIAWPLILWAAHKLRLHGLALLSILIVASFGWSIHETTADAAGAFFLPHARAWELLTGAALAYSNLRRGPLTHRVWTAVLSCLGMALLGLAIFLVNSARSFPGWWALLPTLGAAATIAAGPNAPLNKHVLALRPLVWVGLVSFPLYLWHWPLLSFARIIESQLPPVSTRVVCVLLALALAVLTYFVVERPLRRAGGRWKVAALAVSMAIVGLVGLQTHAHAGLPERRAAQSAAAFNDQFTGPAWEFATNDLCTKRYPFEPHHYSWWFCITNKDAPVTLLLLGDSYANHLYPGLAHDAVFQHQTILSFGTCGVDTGRAGDVPTPATRSPCSGSRPYKQRKYIDELVETHPSLRYVIIDGLNAQVDDDYITRVDERISFLEQHQVQVIAFVPHVRWDHDLKSCFARPFKQVTASCNLPAETRAKIDASFAPLVAKMSARHPKLKFFDQNQVFCDKQKCPLVIDGMPLFRDEHSHYTEYASSKLASAFRAWAEREVPELVTR